MGGKVDHRSDIYSLGCVLFEALTGTPPFVGESAMSTMFMHQGGKIPTLKEASLGREFPPVLEQIVRSMLAKDPDERYQNLGFAAHDLAVMKHNDTPKDTVAINVPRPVKPAVAAPDMVNIPKNHFYSTLLATATVCAMLTGTVMQITHPVKRAPVADEKTPHNSFDGFESPLKSLGELSDAKKDIIEKIRNKSVDFKAIDYPTDETLEAFKNYNEVQHLELINCKITDAGLKNLRKSKLLRLILFKDKNVKSVDEIANFNYLQVLNLRETGITNLAIPQLAKLPMLEDLDISDCNITEPSLLALTSSPSLKVVRLSKDQCSPETVSRLQSKMPECVFPGYFDDKCSLDKSKSVEYKFSVVSKANPLSRSAAQYLFEMAVNDYSAGRSKEAWEHLKQAEKISKKTKDFKLWHSLLEGEVAYLSTHGGSKQEVAKIRDRALQMDIDTNLHDDQGLLIRVVQAASIARQAGKLEKVIEHNKTGLKLVDQFPDRNQVFLPIFCEKIGWTYIELNQAPKGAPFLRRNLTYWEEHQNDRPQPVQNLGYGELSKSFYARALIELGHAETDTKTRKLLYDKALNLLDTLNLPEELNLKEHYCDACREMDNIYRAELNPAQSINYLNRALSAIKRMKHLDESNRQKFFTDRIASYSNSAK